MWSISFLRTHHWIESEQSWTQFLCSFIWVWFGSSLFSCFISMLSFFSCCSRVVAFAALFFFLSCCVLCGVRITPVMMISKSLMRRYNAPSLGRSFCSAQRPFRVLGLQQVAIGGLDKPVSLCVYVYVADCFRGQFNLFVFNIHCYLVFRL